MKIMKTMSFDMVYTMYYKVYCMWYVVFSSRCKKMASTAYNIETHST